MHLLLCPSCGRRYAVSGAGSLDEWQCRKCSQELTVTRRDVPRLTVMGDLLPVQDASDGRPAAG
jgi:tRNA(Ile2) C34 agmatinyltransferase TiaS